MNVDRLEQEIRDLLADEVAGHAFLLDGLEGRVATELAGRLPRCGPLGFLRRLVAPTRGARLGQLAVVGATAVIFLVVGVFVAGRFPSARESPLAISTPLAAVAEAQAGSQVLFVMPAPNAGSVAVLGTFNNWVPTPLTKNKDGIWTASLTLSPGRYEYAFVIDGRWLGQDPLADEYVHSFGEYNSVRYVGREGDGA
jgi:hypothetical protein